MSKPYLYTLITSHYFAGWKEAFESFNLYGSNPNDLDGPSYDFGDFIQNIPTAKFFVDINRITNILYGYEYIKSRCGIEYKHKPIKDTIEYLRLIEMQMHHFCKNTILFEKVPKNVILEYFKLRNSGILDIL